MIGDQFMKNSRRKKHMLATMTIREIRNTFGRFFAVFAIIGIGVGFFPASVSRPPS
jgi:hypothetical protein